MSTVVSIRVSDELKAQIAELADRLEVKPSQVMHWSIKRALELDDPQVLLPDDVKARVVDDD